MFAYVNHNWIPFLEPTSTLKFFAQGNNRSLWCGAQSQAILITSCFNHCTMLLLNIDYCGTELVSFILVANSTIRFTQAYINIYNYKTLILWLFGKYRIELSIHKGANSYRKQRSQNTKWQTYPIYYKIENGMFVKITSGWDRVNIGQRVSSTGNVTKDPINLSYDL